MSRRRIETIIEGRDPLAFARNVRRARESLGWTRQRLCQEASISPQTLTKVEGGRGCTPGVERRLAEALRTVVGRLWEPQELARQTVRSPGTDRWYFASHADGERYWRSQSFIDEGEPIRYDPDAIQDEAERARMGGAGLVQGFVRVTTAHLRAASVISSVIEVYGRIDSDMPDGRLSYFHALRGEMRFHIGERTFALHTGDVLQAEMASPAWLEPAVPVPPGSPPPLLVYVDLQPRLNPSEHAH